METTNEKTISKTTIKTLGKPIEYKFGNQY